MQLIPKEDEHKFDFDLPDATKIVPEELVPVKIVGKLVFDRNPDNYFAETEPVAFLPSNIVPGIYFSNDPLLQGKLHSYLDTQTSRLGGHNFHEIPINRPVAPVHNNQRDSQFRQTINKGRVAYEPNTLGGGCPYQMMWKDGGFASHQEKIDSNKIRTRSDSLRDYFTQSALFFNGQSEAERQHIVDALSFELGKVEIAAIRERMVYILNHIDETLASKVADNFGIDIPATLDLSMNMSYPADADPNDYQPLPKKEARVKKSEVLSMANTVKDAIKTCQIVFLVADGFDAGDVNRMKNALEKQGAQVKIIGIKSKSVKNSDASEMKVGHALRTTASVLWDAVYVPGGESSTATLADDPEAIEFVNEAYRHCRVIAETGAGAKFPTEETYVRKAKDDAAIVTSESNSKDTAQKFINAIARHRGWEREKARKVPAQVL